MVIISDGLNDKVKNFFAPYNERVFEKGQIIIYGGDDPPGIIYLISGHVRVYDINPNGQEVVVNVFKAPSFFPMSWAINKAPNKYFYETGSKIKVKIAPADEAVAFVNANPDVLYDLLSRVYSGMDGVLSRMVQLMGGNAFNRVVYEVINACKRFGKKNPDGSYFVSVRETELAKRAGLTRETFSREIRKLKNTGLIEVTTSGIVIKDLKALEQKLEE